MTICALCKREVLGKVDHPSGEDCANFFMGELKTGDAICYWCINDWAIEKQDQPTEGHA